MHRKLMQNSIDPMKSPTIGAASGFSLQTLSHEHNYFMEPTRLSHSNIKFHDSGSMAKFEAESFDFLSIGTFGVELLNSSTDQEPPTPTLPMSIEDLTDQHMEITENYLDLINYELEKFLDAEETTELMSSDTPERSSQASIMTLSYKPMDSEGHIHMAASACPLQNYLFAASVELVETGREVKRERASLGELFKRTNCNIVVQNDQDDAALKKSCGGAEEQQLPRKGNVAHFMKKVVKKFHSSSAPPNPTKKKFMSKSIVKMFNKKVYPEEMTEKQFMKLEKGRNKSNCKHDESETKKAKKKTIKLALAGICKGASPVNAGHWIKTDSDYFVLEL